MKRSVRKRLLFVLISTMALLYFVLLGFAYVQTEQSTNEVYDEILRNTADSIASRIEVSTGGYRITLPSECLTMYTHNGIDSFYYEVFDSSGHRLLSNARLVNSLQELNAATASEAKTFRLQDKYLRFLALEIPVSETPLKRVTVAIAETLTARERFFAASFIPIAVAQFLAMALSICLVWLFTNHAFVPFDQLRDKIVHRKRGDFTKIPEDSAPAEIEPVLSEFNKMCAELEGTVKTRERFISDAAHQLRTPLAALKTYSSFACELESSEELKDVVRRTDTALNSMSRVVNQLLTLANLDSTSELASLEFQLVDLNNVVSSSNSIAKMQASTKGIELLFTSLPGSATILGNRMGLEQLISNLLENAIQYAPSDTKVYVSLSNENDGIHLIVEDQGPGIPLEERANVFERFYRIRGASGGGSGLGLSIVKEVAAAHSANVNICVPTSGIGTRVIVSFPTPERQLSLQGYYQIPTKLKLI
jgi:two-component system, OmpR family, sensor histidine kinase TctE